jgi:hypothetical protein
MKISIFFILYFFVSNSIFCQSLIGDFGARSKGLGHANLNFVDEWAMFNNVAGISGVDGGTVFFGYDRFPALEGFDRAAAGIVQNIGIGSVGISAFRFGDELYSEQVASAAFGNKIGFVRLGFRVNYYQMRIEEFGTASSLYFDFGGIVELIPELSFAAFISNFTSARLDNAEATALPVVMKVGLSYSPVDKLHLNIDVCKDVLHDPNVKAGIEYLLGRALYLRTGLNSYPFKSFFGAGLKLSRFRIDYAVNTHQLLGPAHQASISFYYVKNDE